MRPSAIQNYLLLENKLYRPLKNTLIDIMICYCEYRQLYRLDIAVVTSTGCVLNLFESASKTSETEILALQTQVKDPNSINSN